jgi:hypothetical protein
MNRQSLDVHIVSSRKTNGAYEWANIRSGRVRISRSISRQQE